MGRYATYQAVRGEQVGAALRGDGSPDLGDLMFDAESDGPSADLTNTFDALAWVLAGPDGDHYDLENPLVAAVRGYREVAPDTPIVNDVDRVPGIAAALSRFDAGLIRARFDPEAMAAADLDPWGTFGDPGWPDTLAESLDMLRTLYDAAAGQGLAVLVDIG